jgi:hypothetical protein
MLKNLKVLGLFAIFFGAGLIYFNFYSNPFLINRDPAAIGKVFDYSHLSGEKLQSAIKNRLIAGIQVEKDQDGIGIALGHFAFVNKYGVRKFACQEYSKVEMTFKGDGNPVSGEASSLVLEGTCKASDDLFSIDHLQIPMAKILGQKPADGVFTYNEGRDIEIRFSNIGDEWPRRWILQSVKLFNPHEAGELLVNSQEVMGFAGHPIVIKF